MKTQHSTEGDLSSPWWFLLYCVVLCFRINGNNICPCSLVLLQLLQTCQRTLLSYFSTPFWGEKRCKGIANFDTHQIFSKLFSKKIINKGLKKRQIYAYPSIIQPIIWFLKN